MVLGDEEQNKIDLRTSLLVQKSMRNTRLEIKDALKTTCLVLNDLMDDPKKKVHH